MNGEAIPPRWLIVVRRDKLELYRNLRESFEADSRVEVILDRRHADQAGEGAPVERRRKPLTPQEADLWETAGFHLIHRAEDLRVYEAEDEPSARDVPRPGPGAAGAG